MNNFRQMGKNEAFWKNEIDRALPYKGFPI
jgi:hypothetical protein